MPDSISPLKTPILSEVESSFAQLNDAIIGHSKWLTEWNTRIICGIPVEEQYISEESHRTCFFGRWYYAEHANFLHHNPEFTAIEALHHQVHVGMRAIVQKTNNREPVTRAEYASFISSLASLTGAVVNLRDQLYNLLLSFDYLTGALNRQAFFHILEQEYALVTRLSGPCCIVLVDIDHFKKINDKFGHAAGDKVLAAISHFIIDNMRPYDSMCRYGGEEFMICMPATTLEAAQTVIERIREGLSKKKIAVSDANFITITASFGIAPMSAKEELKVTIDHADKALYRAKADGRNKTEVWPGKPQPERA